MQHLPTKRQRELIIGNTTLFVGSTPHCGVAGKWNPNPVSILYVFGVDIAEGFFVPPLVGVDRWVHIWYTVRRVGVEGTWRPVSRYTRPKMQRLPSAQPEPIINWTHTQRLYRLSFAFTSTRARPLPNGPPPPQRQRVLTDVMRCHDAFSASFPFSLILNRPLYTFGRNWRWLQLHKESRNHLMIFYTHMCPCLLPLCISP